jgi:hypothetical protein
MIGIRAANVTANRLSCIKARIAASPHLLLGAYDEWG